MIAVGPIAASRRRSGGGSVAPTSTQWRVLILETQNSSSWPTVKEVQLRGSAFGPNLATGGTAAGSRNPGGDLTVPANAFDGNFVTYYQMNSPNPGEWVGYTFSSPVTIEEVYWHLHGPTNDGITQFEVQYHDGSGWVKYWEVLSGVTWTTANEAQTFTNPAAPPALGYESSSVLIGGTSSITPSYFGPSSPTFTVTAGSLPAGLSLNSSTGEISGSATTLGTSSGIQITATAGATSATSAPFSIEVAEGYRYVFVEFLSTGNGYIGCATLKVLDGSTDRALQSAGAVASAIGYTPLGGWEVTRVNDGNDGTSSTSTGSAAGIGVGIQIDLGSSQPFDKIGYRSRHDEFGANESIRTGNVYAKVNSSDAWTHLYTVNIPGGLASNTYVEWTV